MKILVVDDEPVIRDLLATLLEDEGHAVVTAINGLEALEIVRNSNFDLIFSDVHMPIMNGIEFLKNLKEINTSFAMVMMDSYPDNLVKQAEEEGAFTCIHKPFNIGEIRSIVNEVLEGRIGPRVKLTF